MSTILELDSGYTVRVPLTGPFRFDHIMQKYPMPDAPTRPITLDSGDVLQVYYKPPADWPDKDDKAEYELYARHLAYLREATSMQVKRNREQAHDFLLGIDVIKGPHNPLVNRIVRVVKWLLRALGKPLDAMVLRKKFLLFLKLYVIVSVKDWEKIQEVAIAKEVNLDDVLDAAKEMFRGDVGRGGDEGGA
jgi:hypothetical protein